MGLRLLRPDRRDETYRNGNLGGVRQWIESVNPQPDHRFGAPCAAATATDRP